MKTLIVFLSLAVIGTALVVPLKPQTKDEPNCGAKFAAQLLLAHKENTAMCELCLDLVLIGEMYAECDEAYQQQKMDEYCRKKLGTGNLFDKLCEDLINDVMGELEADTEADPSKTCTKIMKSPCSYNGSK